MDGDAGLEKKKERCVLCRVVRPPPAAASPLSTHVSPAHSRVICILNAHLVRVGAVGGWEAVHFPII